MAPASQVMRARLHLLNELRGGTRPPGGAISVKQTAAALGLSHTPVREALARLAGEGVVVTAGERNGFAVPRLGARGVAEHFALLAMLMGGVLASPIHRGDPPDLDDVTGGDPVAVMESLTAWIIGDYGNAQVVRAIVRIGIILAPYRRIEPTVIPDWSSSLQTLAADVGSGRGRTASQLFWRVRIDHAAALLDALERRHDSSDIGQI